MTFSVEYTDSFTGNSSLVDGAYYNENDRSLTVDLNDEIYRYNGVPRSVYEGLRDADSQGGYYGRYVKRSYGPGSHLGNYDYANFFEVSKSTPATSVGTPKNLTVAPTSGVTAGGSVYPLT